MVLLFLFNPLTFPSLATSSRPSMFCPALHTRCLPAAFSQGRSCPLCNHPPENLSGLFRLGWETGGRVITSKYPPSPSWLSCLGTKAQVFILHLLASRMASVKLRVNLPTDTGHPYTLWLHLLFILIYSLTSVTDDLLVLGWNRIVFPSTVFSKVWPTGSWACHKSTESESLQVE